MKFHPSASIIAAACCCVLVLLGLGCDSDGSSSIPTPMIVGSDVIVSEFRALPPFDSIDVAISHAEIVITQGGPQSLRIETDDNIIDEIDTIVFGSVLQIIKQASYTTNHGVEIHISMTSVQMLRLSGVGSMDATGLTSAGTLEVDLAGVGSIDLAGTVDTYDAVHQGVGKIDAENLTSRLADIDLRGLGDCRITVTDQLNGVISGQGDNLLRGESTGGELDHHRNREPYSYLSQQPAATPSSSPRGRPLSSSLPRTAGPA